MTARYPRLLLLLLLVTTGISTTGCRRTIERQVIRDEIVERKNQVVISARLRDGSTVHFDGSGASYQWMMVAGDRVPCIAGRSIQYSFAITPATTLGISADYLFTPTFLLPGNPDLELPDRSVSPGNASIGFILGWRF